MSHHNEQCIVRVGQLVPDFEMATYEPDKQDFGTFSLAEAKRKGEWTILFFYPADFTFVCATEFAALAEQQAAIRELGGRLVTVSTDTKFTHLAWQRHEADLAQARYSMAADPTGKVSRMFGVLIEEEGVALRGTFLISPEGKLMSSEVNFLNLGRNVKELVRRLKANTYLSQHPSEACPAQWNEQGDVTLTPNAALVGNVHAARTGKKG
jgi:NADH-dependent peroxiredoxin subunit C